jgi:hypothetical protein
MGYVQSATKKNQPDSARHRHWELAAALSGRTIDELKENATIYNDMQTGKIELDPRLSNFVPELIDASNIVSAQLLDYYLKRYPTRPHVVLSIGSAHELMLDMLPYHLHDFKLTDDQLEKFVGKREQSTKLLNFVLDKHTF